MRFISHTEAAIAAGTEKLRHAVQEGLDLTTVFHELLAFLGDKRHDIAIESADEDATHFGVRRDLEAADIAREGAIPFAVTVLNQQCLKYNQFLLSEFQNYLGRMAAIPHLCNNFPYLF